MDKLGKTGQIKSVSYDDGYGNRETIKLKSVENNVVKIEHTSVSSEGVATHSVGRITQVGDTIHLNNKTLTPGPKSETVIVKDLSGNIIEKFTNLKISLPSKITEFLKSLRK